ISTISYTLGDAVEDLELGGTNDLDGWGNALDNFLGGNNGANRLESYAGNDILNGQGGADVMIGGTGDDTYFVDITGYYAPVGGHLQFFPGDQVIENAGEGHDTVNAYVSYTLGDNVEDLNLLGRDGLEGFGNDLDNAITGTMGDDRLEGRGGNDVL